MADCCICFICDSRTLFPTLLSAIQARAHVSDGLADVIIFGIEPSERAAATFHSICSAEDIQFKVIDCAAVGGRGGTYGRLFLDRFVPDHYQHLLYVDGDVQVRQSLDPLVRAKVPLGHFLAAPDPMAICAEDPGAGGERLRTYMHRLGVSQDRFTSYFNAGVLRINRDGWGQIGSEAYEFLSRNEALCQWKDQSALNAVSEGRHELMSFRWNFPIFFRNCGVESHIKPTIYHFMSSPKPWQGNFPPWTNEAVVPYRDLLNKYSDLSEYAPGFPAWRTWKYFFQQRGKKISEFLSWRLGPRRVRIMAAERMAVTL